jgi:hypothetical protein
MRRLLNPPPPPPPKPTISLEYLVGILAIEPGIGQSEIDMILGSNSNETDPSEGLFAGVPQDKRFQQWLTTEESEILFVEDNMGSLERERISKLSVFCAGLTRSLREDHAVISIQFFCGRHDVPQDENPLCGPAGLIRSLIFQLIRTSGYASFDLDFLFPAKIRNSISKGDVATLCWVLEKLVKQLPLDTVLFCFVDGLSFFEGRKYKPETMEIIECLQRLVQDQKLQSIFKLLIMHLSPNGHRKYLVNPGDCLLLSRQSEFEGYGLTEREIAAKVRRIRVKERTPVVEAYDFSGSEESEAENWNGDLLQS